MVFIINPSNRDVNRGQMDIHFKRKELFSISNKYWKMIPKWLYFRVINAIKSSKLQIIFNSTGKGQLVEFYTPTYLYLTSTCFMLCSEYIPNSYSEIFRKISISKSYKILHSDFV